MTLTERDIDILTIIFIIVMICSLCYDGIYLLYGSQGGGF